MLAELQLHVSLHFFDYYKPIVNSLTLIARRAVTTFFLRRQRTEGSPTPKIEPMLSPPDSVIRMLTEVRVLNSVECESEPEC